MGKAEKALAEQWPNVAFTTLPNAFPHSHPHLAVSRLLGYRLLITLAIQELRSRSLDDEEEKTPHIIDVGGRLSYAAQQNRDYPRHQVFCNQPKLSNEDYMRAEQPGVPQCDHTFQTCQCCPNAVMLFNHSLYYIPLRELVDGMARRKHRGRAVAIALVHTWPDVAGKLAEAKYERVEEDTIRMTVPGGRTYQHPAMNWLVTTPGNRLRTELGVLMWDVVRHIGNPQQPPIACVYKFVLQENAILDQAPNIPAPPAWEQVDQWRDVYSGPLQGPNTLRLGELDLRTEATLAIGKIIIFRFAGHKSVIVPKKPLYDAIISMVGKIKTNDEYRSLLNRIKSHLDQTDYPSEYKAQITPIIGALALTRSAALDRVAADHIQASRDELDDHAVASVNAFQPRPYWRRLLDQVTALPGDAIAFSTDCLNNYRYRRYSAIIGDTTRFASKYWWLLIIMYGCHKLRRTAAARRLLRHMLTGASDATQRIIGPSPSVPSTDTTSIKYFESIIDGLSQQSDQARVALKPLRDHVRWLRLFAVGLVTPLLEEMLKSGLAMAAGTTRSVTATAFGLVEWGARSFAAAGFPACAMHALTGRFGILGGILVHAAFNSAIVLAQDGSVAPGAGPLLVTIGGAVAGCVATSLLGMQNIATAQPHSDTNANTAPHIAVPEFKTVTPPAIISTANTSKDLAPTTATVRVRTGYPVGAAGKAYAQALGLVVLPAPAVVASTQFSERVSVTARAFPDIFPATSLTDQRAYAEFLEDYCTHLFGPPLKLYPVARQAFLAHYPPAQRRQYEQAFLELDRGADPFTRRNLRIGLFIKLEALVGKVIVTDYASELKSCPDAASQRDSIQPAIDVTPRMISAREGVFQVTVGPTIAALQAHLCSMMNQASHVFITAATTSQKVGAWLLWAQRHGYVGWDEDKTKFDASTKGWKHKLLINQLEKHFSLPKRVCDLLRATLDWKRGRSSHGVEFISTGGETNSGDFTTFINNSLHNYVDKSFVLWQMTGFIPALMHHRSPIHATADLPMEQEDHYFALGGRDCQHHSLNLAHPIRQPPILHLVAGDDAVTLVHQPQWTARTGIPAGPHVLAHIITRYLQLGQIVTGTWRPQIRDVDYCSGMVWPMGDHWLFGPTPGRILTKMPWVKVDVRAKMDRRGRHQTGLTLLRGNALGVWPICQHIPILREYVLHILQNTSHITAKPAVLYRTFSYLSDVLAPGISPGGETFHGYHANTLSALYDRYGWSPTTLTGWSAFLDQHTLTAETSIFARYAPLDAVFARDCVP